MPCCKCPFLAGGKTILYSLSLFKCKQAAAPHHHFLKRLCLDSSCLGYYDNNKQTSVCLWLPSLAVSEAAPYLLYTALHQAGDQHSAIFMCELLNDTSKRLADASPMANIYLACQISGTIGRLDITWCQVSWQATANERAKHGLRSPEEKQQQQHGLKSLDTINGAKCFRTDHRTNSL